MSSPARPAQLEYLRRLLVSVAMFVTASGCASIPIAGHFARPASLVGEWIDIDHTSANDTSLWVLRADGYDGLAHLLAAPAAGASNGVRRVQTRYGSWYLRGALADSAGRAICFARRIGRDGPTCASFTLETVTTAAGERRQLIIHGYRGEHRTGDRELLERSTSEKGP